MAALSAPLPARRHYTLGEWLTLLPLVQRLKRVRNDVVSRRFAARPGTGLAEGLAALDGAKGGNLLVTVAFNVPWAIDLMIRSTRRHMPDWRLAVVDNSNRPEAREAIRAVCEGHGVPWIGLPKNPEYSQNRSHGISLDWAWTNLVAPLAPARFGFIDHDCFPFRATDVVERLAVSPIDGHRGFPPAERVSGAWSLWAGFMFFRRDAFEGRAPLFNPDQILMLDTAGRLWERVYRWLDPADLVFRPTAIEPLDADGRLSAFVIDGRWVHVGGASYDRREDMDAHVAAVRALVEASLEG